VSLSKARKLLLLGILRQSEMHGYLLNAHMAVDAPISLKKPTAYNLLARMEEDGLIVPRTEATGDRERHIYSVTKKGEAEFIKLMRESVGEFNLAEFPGLVCLTWVDALPKREAIKLLKQRRQGIEKFMEHARKVHADSEINRALHASLSASTKSISDYWHKYIAAEFALIDELIEVLGGNK